MIGVKVNTGVFTFERRLIALELKTPIRKKKWKLFLVFSLYTSVTFYLCESTICYFDRDSVLRHVNLFKQLGKMYKFLFCFVFLRLIAAAGFIFCQCKQDFSGLKKRGEIPVKVDGYSG